MVWIGLRSDRFHFSDGDDRQKPHEQQEHREEQTERPDISPNIDPGRRVKTPTGWEEVTMQRHDDDEAFEPHPDIHEDRQDPDDDEISTHPLEPKELWRKNVATDHPTITPTEI